MTDLRISIELERRVIRVGDFIYSLDLLADGFQTPAGTVCKIGMSDPRADGSRDIIVSLQDEPS